MSFGPLFRHIAAGSGLTHTEHRALLGIAFFADAETAIAWPRQAKAADVAGIADISNFKRAVRGLIAKGWLERIEHKGNRAYRILTPKGVCADPLRGLSGPPRGSAHTRGSTQTPQGVHTDPLGGSAQTPPSEQPLNNQEQPSPSLRSGGARAPERADHRQLDIEGFCERPEPRPSARPAGPEPRPAVEPEPAKPKRTRRKLPAKPLAEGWRPPDAVIDKLAEEFPSYDLEAELIRHNDWAAAGGHVRADWAASFRNWVRNPERRHVLKSRSPPGQQTGAQAIDAGQEALRVLEERRNARQRIRETGGGGAGEDLGAPSQAKELDASGRRGNLRVIC